jgi:HSP20 family protein
MDRSGANPTNETSTSELQSVPVNVFETGTEVVIVAAMPGIEATNVEIRLENTYLTIKAGKRGPGQERHHYIRREWSYGPYERTIELPGEVHVDIERANATYDNGVVTVALPKATSARTGRVDIQLVQIGGTRGEYVGHRGSVSPGTGPALKQPAP